MADDPTKAGPQHGGERRARQAGILLVGKSLSTVSDAIVPIVIVRLLTKNDVGLLSAILVVYATVSLVLTTGFPAALFHFLPTQPRAERAAIATRFFYILLGLGAALGLGFLGVGSLGEQALFGLSGSAFGPGAVALLTNLCLYPIGDMPIRLLPNLLVIEEQAARAAGISVLKALGTSLATLTPILLGYGVERILLSMSAFGVVQAVASWYLLRRLYRDEPRKRCTIAFREMVRFSLPLGMTDIVSLLNSRLDRYLVGLQFPAPRLAEYHAGAWQVPLVNEVPYAVGRVYASDLARLFSQGKPREALDLLATSIRKVSLVVVPLSLVFVLAAEECMELLFTNEYAAASNVFRCYAVLTLGRVAAFGTVIVATGRPQYVLRASLFTIASNVAISLPLLWWLGFVGPALGTAIAFIPSAWFYCYCIAQAAGVRVRETFPFGAYSRVLWVAAFSSVPALLLKLFVPLPAAVSLLATLILVLGGYAAIGTAVGQISREDWQFVKRALTGRIAERSSTR